MIGHIRESLPEGVLPPDARILVKPIRFDALDLTLKRAVPPPPGGGGAGRK